MTEKPTTFYKLDIQGIVYLVDPATATAYTYDLANPERIGQVIWTDLGTPPRIAFRADREGVLQAKLAALPLPQ
jgi:hypothetical protein